MKHFRNCNLCEAICGIEIEHEEGRIKSIVGDKLDPFSRGHICPKALALKDIYEDRDRLRHPVKRTNGEWQVIGWDEALDETARRLREVQAKFGHDAVGVYQGNPTVHNLGSILNSRELLKSFEDAKQFLGDVSRSASASFRFLAMFGHPFLIPVPDIDRTRFFLIMGANPLASNGSLMTSPDIINRSGRDQTAWRENSLIDPRRTETTRVADEHHFIKPGSDAYLLLAFIHVLFEENLIDPCRLADFTDGFEVIQNCASRCPPDIAEEKTSIPAEEIKRLAREFAASGSAVCYGRVGLSTQRFGGLCQWLINAINILTGNFDRAGGAMFTTPAFDLLMAAKGGDIHNRWQSRVRGLPELWASFRSLRWRKRC
jgi:anaerobic selenocysteine-containing dehydrogenase